MSNIPVEEIVCVRSASGDAGTAGEVGAEERGPLDADAVCSPHVTKALALLQSATADVLQESTANEVVTVCSSGKIVCGDAVAVVDAAVMRDALARAFGLEGARGPWCEVCGTWLPACRCGRASC